MDPEEYLLHADQAKIAWPGAEPLLRAAWQQAAKNQSASGRAIPSSFGFSRSPSGWPAKGETAEAEVRDLVAYPQGDGESLGEATGVSS